MFSGLLSDAKENAVSLNRSSAHNEDEKGEISLLAPTLGAHFPLQIPSTAAFHCQHFVKTKKSQASEGPCLFYKGLFEASECPSQAREGAFKAREGLFKNKVGKHRLVFIFGPGPVHLWFISSPSPKAAAESGLF